MLSERHRFSDRLLVPGNLPMQSISLEVLSVQLRFRCRARLDELEQCMICSVKKAVGAIAPKAVPSASLRIAGS